MKEIWKKIDKYEDLYEISDFGNIRNVKRGNVVKSIINATGYSHVFLYKNGIPKQFLIHRLVAKAFIPNPKMLKEINHLDGVRNNNRIDNLEWCSRKHNVNYNRKFNNMKPKKIMRKNLTNLTVDEFASVRKASKVLGINVNTLIRYLKQHKIVNNFMFVYKESEEI